MRQREADCDYGDDGFHCFEGMLVVKILLVMQQVECIHGRDGSSMSKGEKEKIFQVVIVLRGFEEDISDVFGYKLCPFMGTFGPWSFSLLRVPCRWFLVFFAVE